MLLLSNIYVTSLTTGPPTAQVSPLRQRPYTAGAPYAYAYETEENQYNPKSAVNKP